MHAIIMGAGEGTRMWPISTMVNKHLLKIGGKPVIRHIWEKLSHEPKPPHFALINDITIICLKKDLKDYQWEFRDVEVNFFPIKENTSTAHEFKLAVEHNQDIFAEHDVLLHYGDTITDLDYGHFIKIYNHIKHYQNKPMKAMIAITNNIKHDYSQVITDGDLVTEMIEKPSLTVPSWTGIGIFNVGYIIDAIMGINSDPKDIPTVDFGYHVLPAIVKKGELYAYQYDGRWFDVGNLRSYQKLYKEYQNKDLNL